MSHSDVDLLEEVLRETEAIIAAVTPDQQHRPTPCSDYDVSELIDHLVGWARNFAARSTRASSTEAPDDYHSGANPAMEFQVAARSIVAAHRTTGEPADQLPAGFLIMEFLTHGWDLAKATNQVATFPLRGAELGLRTGKEMLKPELRGTAFLPAFEVLPAAGAVDQLVAFMGRNPGWQPAP